MKKRDPDLSVGWAERQRALEEERREDEETREIQDADRERERQRQLVVARRLAKGFGSGTPREAIVEVFTLPIESFFDYGGLDPNPEVYVEALNDTCVDFFREGEHIGQLTIDGLRWIVAAFTESNLVLIRRMLFDAAELQELEIVRL